MPGPQFKGVDERPAPTRLLSLVDRFNTLGLGKDVPIAETNAASRCSRWSTGKLVDLRVPYPLGFIHQERRRRIDDPSAGWKGRGLWTTSGTRTVFHNGRHAEPAQGVQVPGAAEPARELTS